MNIKNKKCSNCKLEKDISCFYNKKSEGRMTSWCRKCLYTYQHIRIKERKKKAIELLGGKCCICGYKKNMAAMHFHHIKEKNKVFSFSVRWSWKRLIDELKKCTVLCANCHAEIHNPEMALCAPVFDNPALREIVSDGKCPVCHEDVYGTKFCSVPCAKFAKRKVKRPGVEELRRKIETMSWVSIGKEYGVTDNAIKKWARTYGLIS